MESARVGDASGASRKLAGYAFPDTSRGRTRVAARTLTARLGEARGLLTAKEEERVKADIWRCVGGVCRTLRRCEGYVLRDRVSG